MSGFDMGPSAMAQGKTLGQSKGIGYGPKKKNVNAIYPVRNSSGALFLTG